MNRFFVLIVMAISAFAGNIVMNASWDGNTVNLSLLANLSEESRTAKLTWDRSQADISSYSFSGLLIEDKPVIDSISMTLILPSEGFLDMSLSFTAISDTVDFSISMVAGDMSDSKKPGEIGLFMEEITITKDNPGAVSGRGYIKTSPNPFNAKVEISLPEKEQINIYSQSGRLIHSALPSGSTYIWDATTTDGESIASGIYYITTHSESAIGRVLYLK